MEGGRTALGGYFYQIVGLVGLLARAQLKEAQESDEELNVLMTYLHEGGRIHHEYLDEDGVLKHLGLNATDTFVLMQFKYSQQASPPALRPTELDAICDQFRRMATRLEKRGQHVDRCVLITNRHIASDQQTDEPIERPIKGKLSLRAITRISEEDWQEGVRTFGWKHGCFDDEIQGGFHQLVGRLTDDAAHGRSPELTHKDLVQALTGFEAQRLTSDVVVQTDTPCFEQFLSGLDLPGQPVRRTVLKDLDAAVAKRALIILDGPGGTGKSVALYHWMQGLRERMQRGEMYATLRRIQDIQPHYLACILREWAHDHHGRRGRSGENPDDFLQRLTQALRPRDPHPIFHLGLDGLDEENLSYYPQEVGRLISWFWQEDVRCRAGSLPRSTLILTCRDLDKDDRRRRLLTSTIGSLGTIGNGSLKCITLGDFSEQEIQRELIPMVRQQHPDIALLVEQILHQSVHSTLRTMPGGLSAYRDQEIGSPFSSLLSIPGQTSSGGFSATQQEVARILCYPVFWQAFLALERVEDQVRILQGDLEAFQVLAEKFFSWFWAKASRRGLALSKQQICDTLRPLAQHCQQSGGTVFDRAVFYEQVQASRVLFPQQEEHLYEEALSAGLFVLQQGSRWSWRFQFLRDHLAN